MVCILEWVKSSHPTKSKRPKSVLALELFGVTGGPNTLPLSLSGPPPEMLNSGAHTEEGTRWPKRLVLVTWSNSTLADLR